MIEFVDELPPAHTGRSYDRCIQSQKINEAFADALKGEPGRWAKWPNSRRSTASSLRSLASAINNGRPYAPSALRNGFEAAARGPVLYVRFRGGLPDDTSASAVTHQPPANPAD